MTVLPGLCEAVEIELRCGCSDRRIFLEGGYMLNGFAIESLRVPWLDVRKLLPFGVGWLAGYEEWHEIDHTSRIYNVLSIRADMRATSRRRQVCMWSVYRLEHSAQQET